MWVHHAEWLEIAPVKDAAPSIGAEGEERRRSIGGRDLCSSLYHYGGNIACQRLLGVRAAEAMANDPGSGPLRSCTIITTELNAVTAPIHNRIPVILPPDRQSGWLSRETPLVALATFVVPYRADAMRTYPVSTRVNTPRNQDASFIEPVPVPGSGDRCFNPAF